MNKYNFQSTFKDHLNDYINLMVSKGYKTYSFYYLFRFDTFLIESNYEYDYISKDIIDKWSILLNTEKKNTRNSRVSSVRGFCKYLNSIGINAYVPHDRLAGNTTTPYILSKDEIVKLFLAIDNESKVIKCNHYRYMLPVFFRLLYSCGLRNNEACCIRIKDVNFDNNTISIIDAKNNKDRLVYMSLDMKKLIYTYVIKLQSYMISDWLFPSSNAEKHILKTTVDGYFNRFVKEAGLGTKEFHPVPHSLRHTYVVHRVDLWILEGKNVNELLIYLSKQLGHKSLSETHYYYHVLNTSFKPILEKSRNIIPEVVSYEE